MTTIEKEEVTTETVEVHICDFCNQEIDGRPVPVAVNPRAKVTTYDRIEDFKIASAGVGRERHFSPKTRMHADPQAPPAVVEHRLKVEAEDSGDLCRHCADNLGLGDDE